MKITYLRQGIGLLLVLVLFGIPFSSEAKSGCCSWHGGVDYCGASGFFICNDGSRSPTCTCGGSYFETIPSCPIFASYNSLSGSCECMYGYVSDGTKCISEDTACENQYGYHATSSYGGKCKCRYGYKFNERGDKCVSNEDYCREMDWNAEYDFLGDKCVCKDGYKAGISGTSCVLDFDDHPIYSPPYSPAYTCPPHSHENPLNTDKCLCDTGYSVIGNSCVLNKLQTSSSSVSSSFCGPNSYYSSYLGCKCDPGYSMTGGSCVLNPTVKVVVPTACQTKNPCTCVSGYMPSGNTKCVPVTSKSSSSKKAKKSSTSSKSNTPEIVQCKNLGKTKTCQCPIGYKPNRNASQCIRNTK